MVAPVQVPDGAPVFLERSKPGSCDWLPVGIPRRSIQRDVTVPEELGSFEYGCAVMEPVLPPPEPPLPQSSMQVEEETVSVTGTETPVAPVALN
jgi:hypothetical protein